ncbi:IdeS/Mac family cysteine endopeptidase [Treponema denticola]|uniref:IdeS/Mac family cysteine endopeptidase n=1 Tax=Treponema denticola TaxID=158 RepID=UPI0021036F6B|nr:IdeS/Mac family cysteine endopeptidase [Treponema denticola]UTY27061.1 hypothetical protein E4N77_10665 [Treponema denticola]
MIKKHKLIGFAAVAAFFLLLSCKNNLSPEIPVEDIIISPHNEGKISIVSGMSKNITVKIIPENATNKTLAYSSTPGGVAAIDSSGSIRAGKVGNAVIKITAANGVKREIKVTVVQDQNSVTSIEFEEQPADPVELIIGESYELKLKVMPETAANKTLNITSSNDSVAWPNGDGNRWIKAKKEGEAIITITSVSNPSVKKEVRFKIKPLPSIELITEEITSESGESNLNLKIKTLNGKLSYTPKIVGEESSWLTVVRVNNTTDVGKDTIYLKAAQNKTVWKRTAYINFKDGSNQEIKNADGKKLEVKVVQKENKNPTVRIQWVHGIDGPAPNKKTKIEVPHVGQAKKFYWDDDKIFFWYEDANTKWFNNRKIFYLNIPATDGGDSNQCWAKTASNMLHWWFLQNKENIENYITKKNITSPKKDEYQYFYNRNSPDNEEPEKSYIAKTFRTKAHNGQLGGYVMSGLAWYLYGNTSASHPSTPTYEGPALFKDVFNIDKTPIEDKIIKSKLEFEKTITEALNSKKAIGLHMRGTKGGKDYAHGITLWGAVFDEEENIIAIYVVDNNHTENRIFPYGIYYRDGLPYIFNYPNNDFATNRYVGEVITLDKGEAQWKEWFDNNP